MTKLEKLIVSAYTGVLMVDMADFKNFAEGVMQRKMEEYEFLIQPTWDILKKKTEHKFMELCRGEQYDT